ncbi:Transcription and mRNA export factor eny2 [Blastocladiella emersonii ATCC 22665]|nr:Transcription and mRNA export factor eny2 [Blastocladiella emersonii ATCC 22665]
MDHQAVYQKLVVSGQREQVKDFLREQLAESGWRDQVRLKIKEVIDREGIDRVTVDSIMAQVLPVAQEMVPDTTRQQLYNRIGSAINASARTSS